MNLFNIKDMIKGWFVGDITPVAFTSSNCEVAYKEYKKGEYHPGHYHKIATEITLLTEGLVEMNNVQYKSGDIIIINPFEVTDFRVLEDTKTVVVKVPGAKNDKYDA
jgi:quercetin dioxygenase-like cupin family protein